MNFGTLAIEYKQLVKLIKARTETITDTSFVRILSKLQIEQIIHQRNCRRRRESKFYQLLYPSIAMQ